MTVAYIQRWSMLQPIRSVHSSHDRLAYGPPTLSSSMSIYIHPFAGGFRLDSLRRKRKGLHGGWLDNVVVTHANQYLHDRHRTVGPLHRAPGPAMVSCCRKSQQLQSMQARQDVNAYPKEWKASCWYVLMTIWRRWLTREKSTISDAS